MYVCSGGGAARGELVKFLTTTAKKYEWRQQRVYAMAYKQNCKLEALLLQLEEVTGWVNVTGSDQREVWRQCGTPTGTSSHGFKGDERIKGEEED